MPADENTNPAPARAARAPDPARYGQGPRGTRDFYPLEMAKRRWIEERWRKVAVRFGFEEIDGPRFEHLDTYTVKSGEGIVSELFSFTRAGGETEFALRPEFTPTLARMVAAKASALPKPIKWFSIGPYFRAERPQRGRLREFLQWNVDMVGDPSPEADAEIIACCVEFLTECGLTEKDVRVEINHRTVLAKILTVNNSIPEQFVDQMIEIVDAFKKISKDDFVARVSALLRRDEAFSTALYQKLGKLLEEHHSLEEMDTVFRENSDLSWGWHRYPELFRQVGLYEWCDYAPGLARGLAYYTGTVFEVHEATGAERAIAGGGRYDNLVELFGGPPTPAVGFAMGDVVLSLVLQDKGLMPTDEQIARDLGLNPDVFVFSVDESLDAHAAAFLARCRRERLHARRSYKATRNVGKLLKDASSQRARAAVFFEPSPDGGAFRVQVKDLQGGTPQQDFASVDKALEFLRTLRG